MAIRSMRNCQSLACKRMFAGRKFFSTMSAGAISVDKLAMINTWLSSMLFHTSLPTRYGAYLDT